jgi:hypothetical protein
MNRLRIHAANILLAAGIVILLFAIWFLITDRTVIGYTGPGIAKAPANRFDKLNGVGLLFLSIFCVYYGWTLIRKKRAD